MELSHLAELLLESQTGQTFGPSAQPTNYLIWNPANIHVLLFFPDKHIFGWSRRPYCKVTEPNVEQTNLRQLCFELISKQESLEFCNCLLRFVLCEWGLLLTEFGGTCSRRGAEDSKFIGTCFAPQFSHWFRFGRCWRNEESLDGGETGIPGGNTVT